MAVQNQVPVTESVTTVDFAISDPHYPFVGASVEGGQVMLEEIIPRGDGEYGEFYCITDTDPDEILALADQHDSVEPELLTRYDDGGLFEFVVSDNCPAVFLGEQGALPRRVESIDCKGIISAEIPAELSAPEIIERFLDAHPGAEMVAKRQQPYSTQLFGHREFTRVIEEALTDRQQEVLAAAHEAGFYEWPRETDGKELAGELGISPPTLHQHLRAAEQKLITVFLDQPSSRAIE